MAGDVYFMTSVERLPAENRKKRHLCEAELLSEVLVSRLNWILQGYCSGKRPLQAPGSCFNRRDIFCWEE